MLEQKTIKKIIEFVKVEPRTIQEVAKKISKNWRTADSYIQKISKELGTIKIKTFRGGTRGALKIVYWNNLETPFDSQSQERLFRKIEIGKKPIDFSPFDIYQYIDNDKRYSFFEEQGEEIFNIKQDLVGTLRKTQKKVLIFSGSMSWANIKQGKVNLIEIFEELARKGVVINFITKIDITSIDNVKKVCAINEKVGKDMIIVRHCEQPLRAFIVDDKFVNLKEIKDPKDMDKPKKMFIFYVISDKDWIKWLEKVFYYFFSTGISFKKRIEDLKTVRRL